MRSLLFLLALCMVTALRAVSIQWTVPNSQYDDWFNTSTTGVYFVYTQSPVEYSMLAPTKINDKIVPGSGTVANSYGFYMGGPVVGDLAGAQAQFTDIPGTSRYYYYMVVYSKTNTEQYAVAGGIQYDVLNGGSSTGIYDQTVDGEKPEFGDYVDVGWIGGTWNAALVPEPTVLALLALGVAGVALRRKTI